jgi:hypothetical protein
MGGFGARGFGGPPGGGFASSGVDMSTMLQMQAQQQQMQMQQMLAAQQRQLAAQQAQLQASQRGDVSARPAGPTDVAADDAVTPREAAAARIASRKANRAARAAARQARTQQLRAQTGR